MMKLVFLYGIMRASLIRSKKHSSFHIILVPVTSKPFTSVLYPESLGTYMKASLCGFLRPSTNSGIDLVFYPLG